MRLRLLACSNSLIEMLRRWNSSAALGIRCTIPNKHPSVLVMSTARKPTTGSVVPRKAGNMHEASQPCLRSAGGVHGRVHFIPASGRLNLVGKQWQPAARMISSKRTQR